MKFDYTKGNCIECNSSGLYVYIPHGQESTDGICDICLEIALKKQEVIL